MIYKPAFALLLCCALSAGATAQTADHDSTQPRETTTTTQQESTNPQVEPMDKTPVFRVNVVSRTTKAVNYRHRAGSTKVDMKGTDLMPSATGDAKVNSQKGRLEIDLAMQKMRPANTFGPAFLTYVLWAITPEGRSVNLGEVLPNDDGKLSMRVTTDLQAFGLIITAEPYFAVTRPSSLVVADNRVLTQTKGWEQPIDARFEALDRAEYTIDVDPAQLPATHADRNKDGLDLMEARNAVAIAKAEGAAKYAPEALAKAQDFLDRGEDYLRRKQGRSAIGTVARGATQQAEDARVLTIRRKNEERIANERRRLQDQELQARTQSEKDAARATQAQADAAESQRRREQAEQAQAQAEQAAQLAAQQRAAAEAAQQTAQQQVQQAQLAAQQAEQQREQMRARLLQQLNSVLQTRDTARGLIVNMSDVLFDTGKATLRPGARERLARVAGIVQAYPDLRLQIEGHTDNVGSPSYNQVLSEKRAVVVRDYLIQQGVPLNNVTARGLGLEDPVASNATSAGRQMNRRVDLVVSGESIQAHSSAGSQGAPGSTGTAGAAGTVNPNTNPTTNPNTNPSVTPGTISTPPVSQAAPAETPTTPAAPAQPAPVTEAPPSSNPREPVPQSTVPK